MLSLSYLDGFNMFTWKLMCLMPWWDTICKFSLFVNWLNNFSHLTSVKSLEIISFLLKSEEIFLFISTGLQHVLVFNKWLHFSLHTKNIYENEITFYIWKDSPISSVKPRLTFLQFIVGGFVWASLHYKLLSWHVKINEFMKLFKL